MIMKYYATVGLMSVTREKIKHVCCGLFKRHETQKMQFISTEDAVNFFYKSRGNLSVFKSLDDAKVYAAGETAQGRLSRFTVPIYEVDISDDAFRAYGEELNQACVRDIVGVHIFHPNFNESYNEFDAKRWRIMQHNNALELGRLFSHGRSL
jgi:hypothetical protein